MYVFTQPGVSIIEGVQQVAKRKPNETQSMHGYLQETKPVSWQRSARGFGQPSNMVGNQNISRCVGHHAPVNECTLRKAA